MNESARLPPTTVTLQARFNGGALVVSTEPLADDDTTLVTIRGGTTDLSLFPREAYALAEALVAFSDRRREFAAASVADHLEASLAEVPGLSAAQYDDLHAVIRRHHLRARS